MISRRVSLWALAGIVALGLAVRLSFLFRPIQVDESYTLNEYASRPLLEGLGLYTFPNNHLLNTSLVHCFTRWLGPEPWAARLPAFWCGLFIIPAMYAMVAGPCGRLAGLFAAARLRRLRRLSITRPMARVQFRRPGDGAPYLAGRQAP